MGGAVISTVRTVRVEMNVAGGRRRSAAPQGTRRENVRRLAAHS